MCSNLIKSRARSKRLAKTAYCVRGSKQVETPSAKRANWRKATNAGTSSINALDHPPSASQLELAEGVKFLEKNTRLAIPERYLAEGGEWRGY